MVEINKKYFDVIIEQNAYRIEESEFKPHKSASAAATLSKIEEIVKNKLVYSSESKDGYSALTSEELLEKLKNALTTIEEGHKAKVAKLHWIIKFIFGSILGWIGKAEMKIETACMRIQNLISPPAALPGLVRDEIQHILSYLDLPDLASFARVNRQANMHKDLRLLARAKNLGYVGNDHKEANQYVQELYTHISDFCKIGLLPRKLLATKTRVGNHGLWPIDKERTLQKCKLATPSDLFAILADTKAYVENYRSLIKMLIMRALANFDNTIQLSDELKRKGASALILAIHNSRADVVEFLLNHGVEPSTPSADGTTPLHLALHQKKLDITSLLIKAAAKLDALDSIGNSSLIYACGFTSGQPDIAAIALLLEHGANAEIATLTGSRPLHIAAHLGSLDAISLLVNNGVDINALSGTGATSLWYACQGYGRESVSNPLRPAVVDFLLKKGANPNIADASGITPIHIAASKGELDIVELLIEAGAIVNAQTDMEILRWIGR